MRRLAALAAMGLALAARPLASAEEGSGLLRSEFWADLAPVAGVGDEWPVSAQTARARILEEAAWVYGGMIWGFEFAYTPYDKTRTLPERFDIVPIRSLAPGELVLGEGSAAAARSPDMASSPALEAAQGELKAFVEYRPSAALVGLMSSYSRDPWKGSQGLGRADMNLGIKGRRMAYEDALRAAVRSFLQGLEPNKPRLVKGRVVLERVPSMAIIEGAYTSRVRARVMTVEILNYGVY